MLSLFVLNDDKLAANGDLHDDRVGKVGRICSKDASGFWIAEEAACVHEAGKDERGASVKGHDLHSASRVESIWAEETSDG